MILRSWHGAVPVEFGDSFERYLEATGVSEAKAVPGNLGVFHRRARQGRYEHFFLLTYWDRWESVQRFAGDEPWVAVNYPEDSEFDLISDPIVLHQQVAAVQPWYEES